jgi:general secretion pathway protein J
MRGTRVRSPGFTLVELLIALALLGLLTAMLVAGVRYEIQASSRQSTRLERAARLPAAFAFLRAHLSAARPVVPVNSNGTTIVFDGRAVDLDFVDTAPQSAPAGGLYLFKFRIAHRQLRVSWYPFQGLLPVSNVASGDTLLLDDITSGRFRYFGVTGPNARADWHDQWPYASTLPLAIRLDIAFADGARPPPLVVRPRLRLPEMSPAAELR